jgi:formylglycine-generating enzyme required for sulfatase activity
MGRSYIFSMFGAGTIIAILIVTSVQSLGADVIQACVKKGDGRLRIVSNPSRCRPSEVPVSLEGTSCDPDMVKVGPICMDKYEASVWSSPTGGTQFGTILDNYPCSHNGNDCSDPLQPAKMIFARSVARVIPSFKITWFQAQQACVNVGKRLPTNAEWQMAAAGTPDPGTDNGTTDCNISSAGKVVPTGSRSKCVSNFGVFDMVGNLGEWVADWFEGNTSPFTLSMGAAGTDYGNDIIFGVNPATQQGENSANFPAALIRSGTFLGGTTSGIFAFAADVAPSVSSSRVGFRCAR